MLNIYIKAAEKRCFDEHSSTFDNGCRDWIGRELNGFFYRCGVCYFVLFILLNLHLGESVPKKLISGFAQSLAHLDGIGTELSISYIFKYLVSRARVNICLFGTPIINSPFKKAISQYSKYCGRILQEHDRTSKVNYVMYKQPRRFLRKITVPVLVGNKL